MSELAATAQAMVANGKGLLAADESGPTIKKRFDSIGAESTEERRRGYREMLFTTAGLEDAISGVILFDETLRQSAADGTPFPKLLASKGITLISATTGQDVTAAMQEDPMMRAMIQIQGVFAELDKNLLVGKLAKARKLKKERTGRCEGRKPFGTRPGEAEVLKRMKQLYRKPRGGERLGFHPIAMQLNREGLSSRSGKPWSAVTVKRILTR